ncbi:integrase catalytic domain-containing protein [Trichonephila clavipes]|nr:integrase catalytic domain-containing protein [Trichonephila clavipes]
MGHMEEVVEDEDSAIVYYLPHHGVYNRKNIRSAGLIGPVITRAKILFQSLWQLKLDWNDPLPSKLVSYWKSFIDALESINCLDIPRYCLQDKSIRTELHGFTDSSEKAYGAVLYLRCINTSGQIYVRFLCSKSKVAPLKSITIPRLELCAAVLLSKLLKRTLNAFKAVFLKLWGAPPGGAITLRGGREHIENKRFKK